MALSCPVYQYNNQLQTPLGTNYTPGLARADVVVEERGVGEMWGREQAGKGADQRWVMETVAYNRI